MLQDQEACLKDGAAGGVAPTSAQELVTAPGG